MYPQINHNSRKQQPEAKDESVRQEIQQEEDLKSVQPMGNEAANIQLMNQMLREANADNMLDLSEYADQETVIVPFEEKVSSKKPAIPDKISNNPKQAGKPTTRRIRQQY